MVGQGKSKEDFPVLPESENDKKTQECCFQGRSEVAENIEVTFPFSRHFDRVTLTTAA